MLSPDLGAMAESSDDDLLAIDEALCRFEEEDDAKTELVKWPYFAGLSEPDTLTNSESPAPPLAGTGSSRGRGSFGRWSSSDEPGFGGGRPLFRR